MSGMPVEAPGEAHLGLSLLQAQKPLPANHVEFHHLMNASITVFMWGIVKCIFASTLMSPHQQQDHRDRKNKQAGPNHRSDLQHECVLGWTGRLQHSALSASVRGRVYLAAAADTNPIIPHE